MTNLNDTNQTIATILSELYESFPVRSSLYEKNLYRLWHEASQIEKELNVGINYHGARLPKLSLPEEAVQESIRYHETIRWLEHEGIVRDGGTYNYEDKRGGIGGREHTVFCEVVLTPKGFRILNSTSEVLQEIDGATLGQKLNNALQVGTSEVVRTLINEIVLAMTVEEKS